MPIDPHALISVMKSAARVADNAKAGSRAHKAASNLRDKAFAQYVWGE